MDTPSQITEEEQVSNLIKGDFKAFDQLYQSYSKRLYYFALTTLKSSDDARDCVQEVFLRLWKNRESIKKVSSFKSYIFTISYNIILDMLRKRMSEKKFLDDLYQTAVDREPGVDNRYEYEELNARYEKVISELPPKRQEIYRLHRFEHLTYEEIAQKLKVSVSTVKNQVSKAIATIRESIGKDTLLELLFLALFL